MNSEEKTKPEKPRKKWSKRRRIVLSVLAVLLVLIIAEFIRSNTVIEVENFVFEREDVPPGFDGVKIVQITDYHNHGGRLYFPHRGYGRLRTHRHRQGEGLL